jgi:hypothetical protein
MLRPWDARARIDHADAEKAGQVSIGSYRPELDAQAAPWQHVRGGLGSQARKTMWEHRSSGHGPSSQSLGADASVTHCNRSAPPSRGQRRLNCPVFKGITRCVVRRLLRGLYLLGNEHAYNHRHFRTDIDLSHKK